MITAKRAEDGRILLIIGQKKWHINRKEALHLVRKLITLLFK